MIIVHVERPDNTRMLCGDWILMAYASRSRVYKQTVKNTHGIYFSGFWLKKTSVPIVVLSGSDPGF